MLEIACFNTESAVIAQEVGADRIEFCAEAKAGGTTPSFEQLGALKPKLKIPINVMIRPRGGNFEYSTEEFECMKEDIKRFKPLADGFVFGILTKEHGIDVERNRELVQLAKPRLCTFHRAFDEVSKPIKPADEIISCGFSAILTSGCSPQATLGARVLLQLVEHVGNKISIIVGGGVRSSNIVQLKTMTGAEWFHSSAIVDSGEIASREEMVGMLRELNSQTSEST